MIPPHRLLLADDCTEISQAARDAAIELAYEWHSELHVVAVGPRSNGAGDLADAVIEEIGERCDVDGILVHVHRPQGRPVDRILEVATAIEAGLVVLGSHPQAELRADASIGRAVTVRAKVPVLLVRQGTWPPDRIVCGDDGSDEAHAAALLAAEIGRHHHARELLVDAIPEARDAGHDPRAVRYARGIVRAESRRLQAEAQQLRAELGSRPSTLISYLPPALAIRECAHEAVAQGHVLIAVGSSGKSQMQRDMGWSVSDRVVGVEPASILVVPRH